MTSIGEIATMTTTIDVGCLPRVHSKAGIERGALVMVAGPRAGGHVQRAATVLMRHPGQVSNLPLRR
jgi:hypothetical protein